MVCSHSYRKHCGAVVAAAALVVGVSGLAVSSMPAFAADGSGMVPLQLKLPKPVFAGTPKDTPIGLNVEKPTGKPRPVPLVPAGTVNLAHKCKVTSSKAPFSGSLSLVTDGVKEAREGTAVELKPGLQWVQIDLGAAHTLHYVLVWHFHEEPVIFRSVVVQLSDDPDFVKDVHTIFNNDQENSSGLGIGKDRQYFETYEGKLIDAKDIKARYVRLYSRGSTYRDPLNRYTEVEVYGTPSK